MTETKTGVRGSEAGGARRTAVLLVAVDAETAERLMGHLAKADQERVALEIARLENVPASKEERDAVLREFYSTALAQQHVEQGGLAYARRLLEKTYPAAEVDRIVQTASARMSPFGFLQRTDKENLLAFIGEEHPQTVALILAHLGPQQSASILESLPVKKQQEIVRRLATMEHTSPEVVQQVERALETRFSGLVTQDLRKTGGVGSAAGILNLVPRSVERGILEGLQEEEPEMVDRIRRLMFTFEDIHRVNDRGVQNLLKNVETSRLSLALKTAAPDLREKFFKNMSQRAAENLREEMEMMGPVRLSDVEAAQQAVVDMVRQLEESGELIVEGRGGAEMVV